MLDTTAMTGLRAKVRPFPHRDSHNRRFFIVRHYLDGSIKYLHRDASGEMVWRRSTHHATEYHYEASGYFATEHAARNTLAAWLRKERARRRMRIPVLPQQVNPLQKAA